MVRIYSFIASLMVVAVMLGSTLHRGVAPKQRLSAYGFFSGRISDQLPAIGTVPYRLNTALFSDNALKLRFISLPQGGSVNYNDSIVFDFPVGTTLIKTFYFPTDFRDLSKGRRLMETRLLIREASGWKALPYIWDEAQTDAVLDVAGEARSVSYTDPEGRKQEHQYFVPNLNQCKGCHNKAEMMTPIGPSARQLSGPLEAGGKGVSQLSEWAARGMLQGLPDSSQLPTAVVWNEPSTGTLDQRARLWLDINCAHCHQPQGPASTTGLYLGVSEKDSLRLGIDKTPVAAGRGSGNLKFDIRPGDPAQSILVHRMASVDPGIMMPELGRTQADPEAVALIREWIRNIQ